MGFLDEFLRSPKTESPFSKSAPGEPEPSRDDPLKSLLSMEAEALDPRNDSLGSPVLPCEKPWLEITLLREDGSPAAGAPFKLSLPGATASGTLDDQGFKRIEGVEVDTAESELEVRVTLDEDGEAVAYELTVVPGKHRAEDGASASPLQDGEPLDRIEFDEQWRPY